MTTEDGGWSHEVRNMVTSTRWTRGWILHGTPEGSREMCDTLTLPMSLPSRFWPPRTLGECVLFGL